MRNITLRVRSEADAISDMRTGFLAAWNSGNYTGEYFDFESANLLNLAFPSERLALIERLQKYGPLDASALAAMTERSLALILDDVRELMKCDLVKADAEGKLYAAARIFVE